MYNNVGSKLKILAKVIAFLESLLGSISGFAIALMLSVGTGIVIMIVSPILAVISSWLLYGIGEMVKASQRINENLSYISYINEKKHLQYVSNTKRKENFRNEAEIEDEAEASERRDVYASQAAETVAVKSENAMIVEIDAHNECVCPNCEKPLFFDSMFGVKTCTHCKTSLRLVKKSSNSKIPR